MTSSMGFGFMAAFAVSGSVVLIARQVHKRLVSDFMKKIEFELMGTRRSSCENKKRVRFAEDVTETSTNNKQHRKKHLSKVKETKMEEKISLCGAKLGEAKAMNYMPENRKILYQGILRYKTLRGCSMSSL